MSATEGNLIVDFSGLWVRFRGLKHHSRGEMDRYLAGLDFAVFPHSLERVLESPALA